MTEIYESKRSTEYGRILLLGAWASAQSLAACYYLLFFLDEGYLPAPFIYNKFDTFMDFFTTLEWAPNPGRYTEWGSVYPPLNFIGLKVLASSLGFIIDGHGLELRADGSPIVAFLICSYLTLPALMLKARCWNVFSLAEKALLYVITLTAAPFLFGIERGNLIIFSLPFISWLISSRGGGQALAFAFLVNIKPYFVLVGGAVLGQPRKAILFALLSSLLFAGTGLVLDENFLVLLPNLFKYSQADDLLSLREVMAFPTSIGAFAVLLRGVDPGRSFGGSDLTFGDIATLLDLARVALVLLTLTSLAVIPTSNSRIKVAISFVLITNIGISPGGYSLSFLIPLLPILFRLQARSFYIFCTMGCLLPLDSMTLLSEDLGSMYSYVSGQEENVIWTLGLGSLVRPVINFVFLIVLISELALTSPGFRLKGSVSGISHAHA